MTTFASHLCDNLMDFAATEYAPEIVAECLGAENGVDFRELHDVMKDIAQEMDLLEDLHGNRCLYESIIAEACQWIGDDLENW